MKSLSLFRIWILLVLATFVAIGIVYAQTVQLSTIIPKPISAAMKQPVAVAHDNGNNTHYAIICTQTGIQVYTLLGGLSRFYAFNQPPLLLKPVTHAAGCEGGKWAVTGPNGTYIFYRINAQPVIRYDGQFGSQLIRGDYIAVHQYSAPNFAVWGPDGFYFINTSGAIAVSNPSIKP